MDTWRCWSKERYMIIRKEHSHFFRGKFVQFIESKKQVSVFASLSNKSAELTWHNCLRKMFLPCVSLL